MLIITVIGPHLYPVQTYFLSEMIALMMSYLNTANVYAIKSSDFHEYIYAMKPGHLIT